MPPWDNQRSRVWITVSSRVDSLFNHLTAAAHGMLHSPIRWKVEAIVWDQLHEDVAHELWDAVYGNLGENA